MDESRQLQIMPRPIIERDMFGYEHHIDEIKVKVAEGQLQDAESIEVSDLVHRDGRPLDRTRAAYRSLVEDVSDAGQRHQCGTFALVEDFERAPLRRSVYAKSCDHDSPVDLHSR